MSAERILEQIAEEEGWTEATRLELALEYINNQGADDAWADFLDAHRADPE